MTPNEVREALGAPYKSFMKGPYAKYPTDAFRSLRLHVSYKEPGLCDAVEFARPGPVIWQGENLLEKTPSDLLRLLSSEDPEVEEDGAGFKSHKLGIAAYIPGYQKDPEDACVEGILVFEEGYYDES
jgi:hypothetical protein